MPQGKHSSLGIYRKWSLRLFTACPCVAENDNSAFLSLQFLLLHLQKSTLVSRAKLWSLFACYVVDFQMRTFVTKAHCLQTCASFCRLLFFFSVVICLSPYFYTFSSRLRSLYVHHTTLPGSRRKGVGTLMHRALAFFTFSSLAFV